MIIQKLRKKEKREGRNIEWEIMKRINVLVDIWLS